MTVTSSIAPFAKYFYNAVQHHCEQLTDFLLPRRCSVCMAELATAPALCSSCWMDLHFIKAPICARTGVPLPFDLGPQSVSLSAMRFPPAYDRARSALIYNGTARDLIHKFKFHNRPEIAELLTPWLQTCGHDLLKDAVTSSPCRYICFVWSAADIISQRNWRACCRTQAVCRCKLNGCGGSKRPRNKWG